MNRNYLLLFGLLMRFIGQALLSHLENIEPVMIRDDRAEFMH